MIINIFVHNAVSMHTACSLELDGQVFTLTNYFFETFKIKTFLFLRFFLLLRLFSKNILNYFRNCIFSYIYSLHYYF